MSAHASPMPFRTYVLLAWHPQVGAAVAPVGVLGIDERPVAIPKTYIAWVPLTYDTAQPWRDRLAEPPSPSQIAIWLEEGGATQLEEVDPPEATRLPDTVEAVLDQLLAEVLPALPPLRDR
jgi:hypothetical protein